MVAFAPDGATGNDDKYVYQTVLLAQMKQLSLETQQRFSVVGTGFVDSNIIISHYQYTVKIYKMGGIYNYSYAMTFTNSNIC